MRYRVFNEKTDIGNGVHFCTYFKTKKEAVAFLAIHGGVVERKVGCDWFAY